MLICYPLGEAAGGFGQAGYLRRNGRVEGG
jgi:hypothetical protein